MKISLFFSKKRKKRVKVSKNERINQKREIEEKKEEDFLSNLKDKINHNQKGELGKFRKANQATRIFPK